MAYLIGHEIKKPDFKTFFNEVLGTPMEIPIRYSSPSETGTAFIRHEKEMKSYRERCAWMWRVVLDKLLDERDTLIGLA